MSENTYNVPGEFELEIPEECKSLGICEDVPNYPEEQTKTVITELKDPGIITDDKLNVTAVPDDTRRVGPIEENIELCQSDQRTLAPKAAIDVKGKWHVVVNSDDNLIQRFTVEMCRPDSPTCANFIVFEAGYQGACIQNYMYEPMVTMHTNGTALRKRLRLPSTCSCVAQRIQS